MGKENIFKMSLSEIDNTMDNVLKETTPEKLSKELYGDKDIKENSNAADTNVATIEEDIKILEELRIANENCIKNAKIKDNPFVSIWEKQNRAIEHVLSDYKRVLKENELLRQQNISYKNNIHNLKEVRNK